MKHPTIPTNHPHTQIIIMFSVTIAEPICFCKQKKKHIAHRHYWRCGCSGCTVCCLLIFFCWHDSIRMKMIAKYLHHLELYDKIAYVSLIGRSCISYFIVFFCRKNRFQIILFHFQSTRSLLVQRFLFYLFIFTDSL